uniref:Immunoglobulin like and fibronectin type III domain containing 1, tandem duplicate 3 n=1 Tax=Astyanax mexicanus TaxID=7994 RepID=A0A8B9HL65_ASTMX
VKSSVPGVMITQYVEQVPAGKSHPDFTRKPIALTIQEGKFAFFKAIITGDPKPDVKWTRNNGDMSDTERYIISYDPIQEEHQLQMPNVSVDQADTYKCFAENEFGRAVVTATLNVIETQREQPQDFKKSLKTRADRPKEERKEGEVDERFWELLLSADKKDYEKICAEYGVTDFRWMLKKLNEKKREIEEQQAQYVEYLGNLRHIEIKNTGSAQFEFEMDLKDPNAKIFLYKDGVMVPFSVDADEKHSLRQTGRRFVFSVNGLSADDAGLYQVDVEGVNVFSTDFKIPMVEFLVKLQEVKAVEREDAVFECVLSAPIPKITWMGKSTPLVQGEKYDITVSEDMLIHRLVVKDCMKVDNGIYAAVVGIKSCNAWLIVEGKIRYNPPRMDPDDLAKFSEPVIIKVGQNASFKLSFVGREPIKVQWFSEGEELLNDTNIKIEKSSIESSLRLTKCQRKNTGEIKLKLKNEFGTIEAVSQLIVLDKPTNPLGPLEVIEASSSCLDFKWRPPKDDGGSPVIHYNLERQQIGRNTWKKIGNIPGEAHYKDTDVDHGRKYCYHIRAITAEGTSDVFETDDIQAAYPGPPSTPKVVSAFKDCINLTWTAPTNTGGTNIVGYILEKRKRGSNLWSQVNRPEDAPSEFVTARDPKKPPGKVIDLKIADSSYSSLSLSWTKPKEEEGVQDEAKGYFVELRPAENTEWTRCNSNAIITNSFTVLGLKSMAMYWVRVVATNEGGDGEPQNLDNYFIAMPPPVRPNFTDRKMKSFLVVRAGNSARVTINFEASPIPTIIWLKDGMPVTKRVTVSNTDGTSQLLIPSAERSDSGVYTIIVKNMVGQETFSTEIRITDDPKPPGPVELEENVPGTLTVSWVPSPDEKRDDRLHYMVAKRDSVKQTWQTVADRVFNNNFTAVNIMPGRQYVFRVYTKNDMGLSEPSESPTWGIMKKKEKFTINIPESKTCNFDSAPTFTVPLKTHASPEKYECYMSCAVRGNPTPRITWYRNNVSINANSNYFISNTCGVCSLLILSVGPKDNGEYKIVAENSLGRNESSTQLTIRGIITLLCPEILLSRLFLQ